ncbi:MAG: signal peptide peptidase SppA [Rubrivivax sp.]|nr:signal peptide peptidase SppA [Rubrivivax sp.]
MPSQSLSWIARALRGLWWLLDASRRALLNLLLLAVLVGLLWGLLRGGTPALQEKTALVLDLSGRIAEQRSAGARDTAIKQLRGQDSGETRLRDVLAVLDAAASDTHISHAVLVLDDFSAAGLPTLREVAAALARFKAAGKPVVAWGADYDQRQYYLAAHASEVWLDPMGTIEVQGYGRYRSYYKDLLDKAGISPNVLRAGKFKNAAETFAANAPSPETLESDGALYRSLWDTWTADVEKARRQPAGSVVQAIDSLPASLVAAGGDLARWALERKWVDALKTRQEMRDALIARGAKDEEHKTFRQVSFNEYLGRLKPKTDGPAIGVVVAEGEISDGQAGPGRIGGRSTAELIRKARDDDKIKALVLRVDSPGGSAFGSELVRRELELTRQAGKPVVVSMGDVAASGGYWISMAADEVIADEATITGSIGVVAMLPTAQGALDKLGVHTGGVTTTWLGGAFDVRRGVNPRFAQLVQASIDHIYRDFTAKVANARKSTPEQIDAVAQGRVWAGRQALALGLVDRLGSYGDALKSAATRAKLPEGYRVKYVEAEPGRLDRLLQRFGVALGVVAGAPVDLQGALVALGLALPASAGVAQDLGWLAEMADKRQPFAAVTHCLCTAP